MKKSTLALLVGVLVFLIISNVGFGVEIVSKTCGSSLPDESTYSWWFGCSPTSAGMLLSWYDRNGYSNFVPGGEAELDTFGNVDALVNDIIASPGHIADFYSDGYNLGGDDVAAPWHDFDCLADFMGTSQDAYGNTNGATTFYYYASNNPISYSQIYSYGPGYYDSSGMYGIYEYVNYAGYEVVQLYNQYIYGYGGVQNGFTFDDYKNEIDSGRGVILHIDDHSIYGYGYVDGTDTVLFHDTWQAAPREMAWGGDYLERNHYGVTVLEVIPEPATVLLFAIGAGVLRRRKI